MNAGIEDNAKTLGNSDHSFALIADSLGSLPVSVLRRKWVDVSRKRVPFITTTLLVGNTTDINQSWQ
jgi:hypothetical protein